MRDRRLQLPQLIITVFLLVLVAAAWLLKMDMAVLFNESLVKLVMNGVLVLSLIPMLNVGAGLNFGLPVGIIGGLLGMLVAVNFRLTGFYGFFAAILFSLVFCLVLGWVYGLILNQRPGGDRRHLYRLFLYPADELFLDPGPLHQPGNALSHWRSGVKTQDQSGEIF